METLYREGKVRAIGLNFQAAHLDTCWKPRR